MQKAWSPYRRLNHVFSAGSSFSLLLPGPELEKISEHRALKHQTTLPIPFSNYVKTRPKRSVFIPCHLSACTVFAICISQLSIEGERFGSDGYVTFRVFSDLVFKYFLPGLTGLFFARKMHSTSEFAKTVLSKSVCA